MAWLHNQIRWIKDTAEQAGLNVSGYKVWASRQMNFFVGRVIESRTIEELRSDLSQMHSFCHGLGWSRNNPFDPAGLKNSGLRKCNSLMTTLDLTKLEATVPMKTEDLYGATMYTLRSYGVPANISTIKIKIASPKQAETFIETIGKFLDQKLLPKKLKIQVLADEDTRQVIEQSHLVKEFKNQFNCEIVVEDDKPVTIPASAYADKQLLLHYMPLQV